ncbi:hypothetical protein CABS02_02684 [Colletotrichum abscissum]|uniref:Uncharacterized protein n=1 Tax=Colletotrichum abscissum TaxID=1671311 RepID=A0A9Q0B8I4_9PEZI|nr:hypothetical protein CABS02_02684 [Colletotrichum abscissum]
MNFASNSTSNLQRPRNMGLPEIAPSDTMTANTPEPAATGAMTANTPEPAATGAMTANTPEPAATDATMADAPEPGTDTAERTARTPDATPELSEAPKLLMETLIEKLEMGGVQNEVDYYNLLAILRFLTPEPDVDDTCTPEPDVDDTCNSPGPEQEIVNPKVLDAMISVFQTELELQMPDPPSAASTQEDVAKQLIFIANKLAISWMKIGSFEQTLATARQ